MTKCELIYVGYDVIVNVFAYFIINGARSTIDVLGPSLFFFLGGGRDWFPLHFATHFSVLWPRGLRRPLAGIAG